MLRLVGVTIPDDVDVFTGLRMIKGLDTKNSKQKIINVLTKAGLYRKELQKNGKYEKVYPKVGELTWKEKARLIELLEMPRAIHRNIRISPKKLRLVADVVRGKDVDEALGILQFLPKGGAPVIKKLLESAIANAGNNHELRADNLYVAKITIDGGATMKRFMARARGRACRIRKRTSHAKIVLREKFSKKLFLTDEEKKQYKNATTKKTTKVTATKEASAKVADKTTKPQGGKE